ncbi:MAG: hypothetical protein AB8C84_03620 [Oligoflexales bacterium]
MTYRVLKCLLLFIGCGGNIYAKRIQLHTAEIKSDLSILYKDPFWVQEIAQRYDFHHDLKWHIKQKKNTQEEVNFSLYGTDICDTMMRVSHHPGQVVVLGEWPTALSIKTNDWPRVRDVSIFLKEKDYRLNEYSGNEPIQCWYEKEDAFYPVWRFYVFENDLPKVVWTDGNDFFQIRNQFFTAQATVRSLTKGLTLQEMRDVTVDLVGNSFLESKYIKTEVTPAEKAEESSHQFLYDYSNPKIAENTSFIGVYETLRWLENLGYKWHLPQAKVKIVLHQDVVIGDQSYKNQAVYFAKDPKGSGDVIIQIADGDDVTLQHLPYEDDIASHEIGHHVVYQYLESVKQTETRGQTEGVEHSGAIHEAFSDYFHAARKNDPCFGESVCLEEGDTLCYVRNQCLRILTNSIAYDTDLYWSLPGYHLKSQLISGWFWDVRLHDGVTASEWDQVVYSAVEFLPEKAVYSDVLIGLAASDIMHFEGKHLCLITETANARGFQNDVAREIPDCKNYVSERLQEKKNRDSVNDGNGKVKTTYCGVIGQDVNLPKYWWGVLFLPLLYSICSQVLIVRFSLAKK